MSLFHTWFCRHPSDRALLEFLDGELRFKRAEQVAKHLASCAECRSRAGRFRDSLECFEQYRSAQLARLGGPPQAFAGFGAKLSAQSVELRKQRVGRGARPAELRHALGSRRRWTTAAATAVALLAVGWMLWRPAATVSASEVLRQARQSETRQLRALRNPVVHQRMAVNARGRAAEWELWRATAARDERAAWSAQDVEREVAGVYAANHMDVDRPLSAEDYADWHDSLADKSDAVTKLGARRLLQITTAVANAEPGQIEQVELLVREEDWHPVSESIYVRAASGEPLRYSIVETSYAVMPMEAVPLRVFHPNEPAPPARTETAKNAQAGMKMPTEMQLLVSQVRVDQVLHKLGADVAEAPEVRNADGRIEVSLWMGEGARREQILSAVKGIQFVTAQDAAAAAMHANATLQAKAERPVYATKPPLAKALAEYAGGDSEAANMIAALNDAERRVYVETAALERLEQAYPEERRLVLPQDLQRAIAQMANDHARAIEREGREYFNLLLPVVEAMASRENRPATPQQSMGQPASREAAAARLRSDLGRLQLLVNRAFLEDHVDTPAKDLSAGEVLSEILQLQTRAEGQLMRLRAWYTPTAN